MKIKLIPFIIIILFTTLKAENFTASGLFLRVPVGARAVGMGNAFTSISDGINSVYWNPAGLSKSTNKEIMFMHNEYIEDLTQDYLAYSFFLPKNKTSLALSLNLFDYGSFAGYKITNGSSGTYTGSFDAKDYCLGITYSHKNSNGINFGITGKYINSKIADSKASAYALDIGWIFNLKKNSEYPINLSFVVKDFGSKIKYNSISEELPITYNLGLSSKFNINQEFNLLSSFDNIFSAEDKYKYAMGCEIAYLNQFFIRLGYNNINEAGTGITFGLGTNYKQLFIDYAFTSYGDLNNSNIISIKYKF